MNKWHLHALIHARYFLSFLILLAPVFAPYVTPTYAALFELQNRYDQMSDSAPNATATHLFGFTYTDLTSPVGSISFEFCSNSAEPIQPCTPSNGLDASGAVLASQSGETGFSISAADTTQNRIVLTRAPQVPVAANADSRYRLDNIINSSDIGTQYVRIELFSSTDGTGTHIEEGGVAYALVPTFNITTEVPPYLKFCASVSITGFDCDSATSFFIDMGEFEAIRAKAASSQFVIATNSGLGFSVTMAGTTLTSGNNIIPALNTQSPSNPGISQFGLNLRANSNPSIGSNPTGPGAAIISPDYSVPNRFKFQQGDIVVSGPGTTDDKKFTTSYITNINGSQPAGIYSTTISFIALANF